MKDYRLLFVSGASGSGTTLLAQVLTATPQVMTVAGKHRTVSRDDMAAFRFSKQINWTTRDMWDRSGDVAQYLDAKQRLPGLIQKMLEFEQYTAMTHVMIKRSAPFYKGDRYRPDMQDLLDILPDVRIILIYRDPRASTYSSFRREFVKNLHNMAVVCEEQLTYLSAQLQQIDPALYRVIGYEKWMQDPLPVIRDLAEFAGLPVDLLLDAAKESKFDASKNDQWRTELSPQDAQFLDQFFNEKRLQRWSFLANAAK